MEYKIGAIEGELPHKFVVARVGEDIVYFASTMEGMPDGYGGFVAKTKHEDIARKYRLIAKGFGKEYDESLEKILGGGEIRENEDVDNPELRIGGTSTDYGSVPKEILERFGLIEAYRGLAEKLFPGIKIKVCPISAFVRSEKWEGIK